jgi:hypothetical protein
VSHRIAWLTVIHWIIECNYMENLILCSFESSLFMLSKVNAQTEGKTASWRSPVETVLFNLHRPETSAKIDSFESRLRKHWASDDKVALHLRGNRCALKKSALRHAEFSSLELAGSRRKICAKLRTDDTPAAARTGKPLSL